MKGRTFKRCQCPPTYRVDESGRRRRVNCRKDHGSWSFTHDGPEGSDGKRRQVMRGGFRTQAEAQDALTQSLAAVAKGEFVETGRDVPTVAEYMTDWLANRRDLRPGTRANYEQHIRNHIEPLIGRIKLSDLRAHHIDRMLTAITRGDAATGRAPVGVATSRRVFSTLRAALNSAVKKRRLTYNPCQGVELEPEHRDEAKVWNADQIRAFLAAVEGDRLALLFRLVLLRGLRRGEACALRWSDVDVDAGMLRVRQSAVQVGGTIHIGLPKTKSSAQAVSFDATTAAAFRAHRTAQSRERLAWAGAYEDNDLVFAQPDGTVERPDRVTRRFKQLAAEAGLPVIRLHDGRHSAATLALEAGASMKEIQGLMRHRTYTLTADTYTHVSQETRDATAERVAKLIDEPPAFKGVSSS